MRFITFDDQTKEIIFNDTSEAEESAESEETKQKFPLGEWFLKYLEFDFASYEENRLRLIEMILTGTIPKNQFNEPINSPFKLACALGIMGFIVNEDRESPPESVLWYQHIYFKTGTLIHLDENRGVIPELEDTINYLKAQKEYFNAAKYCLDIDYRSEFSILSAVERLLVGRVFGDINVGVNDERSVTAGYYLSTPVQNDNRLNELFDNNSSVVKDNSVNSMHQLITIMSEYKTALTVGFSIKYPLQNLHQEFMKMVQLDVKIRRCGYCGRYFLLKGNYDNQFCDRIPQGETRTCQSLGSAKKYQASLKENPVLRAYVRAYNRVYTQMRNKKLGVAEYQEWKSKASKMRESAIAGDVDVETAIEWFSKK